MSTYRILIVEDDSNQLETLEMFLSVEGHKVIMAHNGYEGLRRCEEHRPHLVITDNSMPHMTGLELIQAIRANKHLHHTKMLMVSGDSNNIEVAAITAGVDMFLAKPYDMNVLLQNVASLLK